MSAHADSGSPAADAARIVLRPLAMVLEEARHATVLPLGRRGRGRSSLNAGLPAQLGRIEREAGVREQL